MTILRRTERDKLFCDELFATNWTRRIVCDELDSANCLRRTGLGELSATNRSVTFKNARVSQFFDNATAIIKVAYRCFICTIEGDRTASLREEHEKMGKHQWYIDSRYLDFSYDFLSDVKIPLHPVSRRKRHITHPNNPRKSVSHIRPDAPGSHHLLTLERTIYSKS